MQRLNWEELYLQEASEKLIYTNQIIPSQYKFQYIRRYIYNQVKTNKQISRAAFP